MECVGPATVVFDSSLTAYDFGPSHPMSPIRVDLTMRLARDLGVLDRLAMVPAPFADDGADRDGPRRGADRRRHPRGQGPRLDRGRRPRPRHPRQPGVRRHASRGRPRRRRQPRGVPPGVLRREPAQRQHRRRPAPRHARPFDRLLHLQRRRDRHPVAARPGRRAGRVRRRRRPPRRRRPGDLLRRPAGADDLAARVRRRCCSPAPASPTTRAARTPRAPRSTSPCRRAPPTPAGCGPSTPSCRRWCARSRPQVLVTQHGCDSHMEDPLAHLMLSVDGQRASYLALHDLAHEVTGGRWVATGGGGYALVEVVPRAWTPPARDRRRPPARPGHRDPAGLARLRRDRSAGRAPSRMTDGRTPPGALGGGVRPRHLARPRRSTRPAARSSRCTVSTRWHDRRPGRQPV